MADLSADTTLGPRRPRLKAGVIWLAAPAVLLLLAFMVYPMAEIFRLAVVDQTGFTWKYMAKAMSPGLYARVLGTTFSVSLQVTLWCIVLGYPLAYWLAGLRGRPQRVALFFILLPFWTSALIKNFSWMVVLGRNGIVAQWVEALGLGKADGLLYNQTTVIFAMVHTMLPLAVITMLPVIRQIDPRLYPAAMTLGASGPRAFWQVMIPLSMRGISSASLLIFVASLGFFVTPSLVGGPKQTMIGQLIIMQINQLQNWSQGAALAVMLLLAALVSVFVFDRIFGISSVADASARPHDSRIRRFGLWLSDGVGALADRLPAGLGRPTLNLFAGVMILILMLPIIAFVPMAFSATPELRFPPQGFSLQWFHELFTSQIWLGAITRSLLIGFATAALTVVIGTLAAVALARSKSKAGTPVFLLILSPMIIPPIALAVSMFYLFAKIGLIASNLGIIIGHSVIALPIVFVILLTTVKGYDWRLNDAALTLGASRAQVWRKVALPILQGGLAAGFVTGFLQSFEELTVALFIGGGLKTTLPRQMWDSILLQATPIIACASVVMLLIVMVFFGLLELSQSRRSKKH
ncbi:ABC transporter permease subunit [Thioclava kandeliae]|uniref:ABC transporter permease subunit n=1 Tax=Thioclava kandeliae TaxID=3070818 RepID=A0ABV1SE98_9RHOB